MASSVVLFDLDGVLVDNYSFEPCVLDSVLEEICGIKQISKTAALEVWKSASVSDEGDPRRYSWRYHCRTLGLPDSVWMEAHARCAKELRLVPSVEGVLSSMTGTSKVVVTDANLWIAKFKLYTVGIDNLIDRVWSQDDVGATKLERKYWETLVNGLGAVPDFYIDNKASRLRVLRKCYPSVKTVWFQRREHLDDTGIGVLEPGPDFVDYTIRDARDLLGVLS